AADGQRIVDEKSPFTSVYLLPLAHRAPELLDEAVAHLGNYLFHELTTPLGLRLDHLRLMEGSEEAAAGTVAAPLRSVGTYAVWFPRGLLLRWAGRHACQRLVHGWLATAKEDMSAEVQEEVRLFLEKSLRNPDLEPEAFARRIEAATAGGNLSDAGQTQGEI